MLKKSIAARWFPVLGPVLLALLLAAAFSAYLDRAAPRAGDAAELAALSQRVGQLGEQALTGDAAAFERLEAARSRLSRLSAQADGTAARSRLATLDTQLLELVGTRDDVLSLHTASERMTAALPLLLAASGRLAASLPATELAANQRFLERFELTAQRAERELTVLASGRGNLRAGLERLVDAQSVMRQILAGLAGDDQGLGLQPVPSAAAAELSQVEEVYAGMADALRAALAAGDGMVTAQAATGVIRTTAAELFPLLSVPGGGATAAGWLTLVLVCAAVLVLALLMLLYWRAADLRRAAEIQAAQNERNQQAILRLLDEMGSLADGDLTVRATVSEDITGAIADSINYAIEALRELVLTIRDSAVLVDGAAKHTEATAGKLAQASDRQSRQVTSASESIAQVTRAIEEVSGNAERASDVARHSVDVAHKGGEAVRRTIVGMNTIRETIQDTSKRIKRLGESSQEIGNIVELINDIAEQTNILALNASIQASMAGEAGRGFAVVADEVQRLAERSAHATRQIEVLVRTIQSDTNEAVVSMERSTTDVVGGALLAENAGAALEEIEQVSNQIASLVQNISSSARQQTDAAEDITHNMSALRQISVETAEGAGATASEIAKLVTLASQLRATVSGFRLPVGANEAEAMQQTSRIYREIQGEPVALTVPELEEAEPLGDDDTRGHTPEAEPLRKRSG
ncbi:MAG: methyl-accepting chemotaxis protein [Gammaproteobacteria bacterium]|nr:methyl-accepting chemotaxis protein [Gammaproteobacteria bacterium]